MVGSAMDSSVLSTISTKKARQRAAIGIHAARRDGYVREGDGVVAVAVTVMEASCRAAFEHRTNRQPR
jgi:hypothetical protein